MNLIKARFLRYGEPSGREYTYISNVPVKVGDLVQLNERGQGIVTEINVPESEVESFRDRLKSIIGKVEVKETEAADNESEAVLDE
ncbi:MAG TPA: hypothetical protein DEG06_05165 [Lachnospiraceae bacterium]|jgi:hypothetical protein|nr:hypothetical protein [Lachnospiraceae bacterium]HBY71614.1 hypothetical protein [Lachnospiraceae bacterium]HCA69345.1 hypothetical protein [Lachnospiraceae bacterium]HCM12745.1 hypothetical protein [Lachnospiraceae bacterium]HCR39374.1 hypothetical protein [Lachnospiraceae bacterium]